ncbi:MAG TPA: FeoB small GTPase domain-containing protein [Thermotogota bacterium]|nr:FeoB small GTPase domain-containing protein [Thermotogota bacterium]HRW35567.1 FeoB small GTPase domain-containing protein [Thermotogota bacterium]
MNLKFTIALTGQPNAGKSTLFNTLTGSRQFIANYPGVTVEKKTGVYKYQDDKYTVIDLPGTYSLTAYSLEERVARAVILEEKPQLVVHVMDASNLSRSLSFTFQLMELGCPVLIALNMIDVAKARGIEIDVEAFESKLGLKVAPVIANKSKGIDMLKQFIANACNANLNRTIAFSEHMKVDYGPQVEAVIEQIEKTLSQMEELQTLPLRWLAVKFLENDNEVEQLINGKKIKNPILAKELGDS